MGGNPVSRSDPSGNCPVCVLAAFGLAATELATSDVPMIGGGLVRAGGEAAAELTAKAVAIHEALDPIALSMRTTAVLRTSAGDVAAGGARDLTSTQRAVAESLDAAPVALPGAHAEVTAIVNAQKNGSQPQFLQVTRDICPACAAFIESVGGTVTGARSAKW